MVNLSNSFDPAFLLKYAAIPTSVVDNNFRYINVSDSWLEHHGFILENIIGKTVFELFPTMSDEWQELFKKSLTGQKNIKEDTVIIKNKKLHIQWSIIPWQLPDKSIGGLVIMLDDITEKKKLEEELKQSNERFRTAFEYSSIGMGVVSPEGKWLQVNNELCKILGYSKKELLQLTFQEITEPEDLKRDMIKLQQLVSGKTDHYNTEKRYIHKNGEIIWVYLAITLIKDDKGRPLHFVSQIIDRTIAKKAEDQIKKSREELQKIMDESLDIICNLSYQGEVLQINKACKEIWGYEPEELIGTILTKLVIEEDLEKTLNAAAFVRGGKNLRNFENRYRKKDGSIVPMIWSIRGNNSDNTIFAIVQDATEKKVTEEKLTLLNNQLEKRAQELAISNQYLEEFAFVASHDLQEPLRMISSFLELLQKKYDSIIDETGKKYIHYARDGANRMQKMILGLLEYSTVGNSTKKYQPIDLNELITEAIDLNKYNISKKNAIINTDKLPVIIGNPSTLLQLFHNLLSNGLKYQKQENIPEINIHVTEKETSWQFVFSDNGIGIENKFSDKIFNLFQRLHNRKEYSGSGIGLSICKRIVENHNGSMWVQSELGKGSSFYFTIDKELKN